VSAVSGRLVERYDSFVGRGAWLRYPLRRLLIRGFRRNSCGLMGEAIFDNTGATRFEGTYYVGETAVRGPWALRRGDLVASGYLDEAHFFLGHDDHDFHRRMYEAHGTLPVYCPLNIFSPRAAGPTRRERHGTNAEVFALLAETRTWSPEYRDFLRRYRPYRDCRAFEPAGIAATHETG
jgi:hypothetical protein